MKELGDAYVKAEFRLHKTAEPARARAFFTEWEHYLQHVIETAKAQEEVLSSPDAASGTQVVEAVADLRFGADLPRDVTLTEEQAAQLEKLREAASRVGSGDRR
jgi:hypothetical protein